jgi:hypothetical protein
VTAPRLGRRLVAVLALTVPTVVSAQGRVTSPPIAHPAIASLLPDGAYEMTLTPATGDSRAFASAKPFQIGAQIAHAGTETTITTSDGMTLRGASSPTHLKASGPVRGATLTLELGGSGAQASGTWTLRGKGEHQVTGTVTVAPSPRYQAHTAKQGGCSGFFDCVSQITGYAWKTIFG